MKTLTLVDKLPAYFLFDNAILGNFTLTTPRERFLINEYAIDIDGIVESPSHHFSSTFKDIDFPKKKTYEDMLPFPYKAMPCRLSYAFYLDIHHAYAQIADVFGYECNFREARYFGYGKTYNVALCEKFKIARALIVSGTGKTSRMQRWNNHEITTKEFPNRNYAPCLRYAVFALLHSLHSAIGHHSVYAHTDGFIIPHYRLSTVETILERYHIAYTIKGEGYTEIYGIGNYRIGDKRTNNRKLFKRQSNTSNIRDINMDWWLSKFRDGYELRH